MESALSPSVKNLLCSIGLGIWKNCQDSNNISLGSTVSDYAFLDINGFINFEESFNSLKPEEGDAMDSSFYTRAAFKLSSTFKECEKFWAMIDTEEFSAEYKQRFEWTSNKELFIDTYDMLKQRSGNRDILALLLISTGIEHSLRNMFILENEQCPMLLRDILASKEMENILGKPVIHLFHILLGPPNSMNLRNIAWHGFLCEEEIPPRYAFFLLIFVASLSDRLSSQCVDRQAMISRQYYPLSKVNCILDSFPDLSDDLLHSIRENILISWVACDRNKRLIQDVFDLHFEKKYGFSSVQGFPILEHALRCQFVKVNDCPHRLLTAEATSLYTTFEEILDGVLPDGKENRLVKELGEPFLDLLHDLLIYPSGPRARDRLGHGEADVYNTPPSLSLMVIICLGYLSVKGRDKYNSRQADPCMQGLMACVGNYESQFHPVTELKQKILSLSPKTTQIFEELRIDPNLQPWSSKSQPEIFTESNSTFQKIVSMSNDLLSLTEKYNLWNTSEMKARLSTPFEKIHNMIREALRKRVSTLHRWQKKAKCQTSNISESEIIGLMYRIICEMFIVLDQMEYALQQRQEALDKRLLRSRQRDNTKKLIYLVPNTSITVHYLTILWTWLFRLLNQPDEEITPHFKRIQKFLKSTLQIVENLRTYTSKDNNKWMLADEILVTFAKDGVKFISGFDK